ncbi:glycosyl transferase family 4 [Candidatus Woesearchaeota archaeon]|nr:glycosyl transferase family 4 [Candidatus Woesearchaeota archaeon]
MLSKIYLPLAVSFLVTLIVIPIWIRRAKAHRLVSRDMHKPGKRVAELGGLAVLCGFFTGMLAYVAAEVFLSGITSNMMMVFAALFSVLIAGIIGLVDDILGWKIGLRKYQKLILTIAIAFPIIAINAGDSLITLPFIGKMNVGLLYPFVLIPLGLIGASNGFNIIAGYNGLEAGMGIVILSALGYISLITNSPVAAILAFCMVAALIAFLIFNIYPAKIFPGDILTYPVGALIAIIAIFGNIEKFALILFIPYFIEGFLKLRGMFQKESFGKVSKDGSLVRPYKKFYGLEHVAISLLRKIKRKAYEWEVTLLLILIEIIIALFVILYYF